jgi:hypothetical protein
MAEPSTLYAGNLGRYGTHIAVAKEEVSDKAWNKLLELSKTPEYQKSKAVKWDEFVHGQQIIAKIGIGECASLPEQTLIAKIKNANSFIEVEAINPEDLEFTLAPCDNGKIQPPKKAYFNSDMVKAIDPITEIPEESLERSYELIISPEKYEKLSGLVEKRFGQQLEEINSIRINKNSLYELVLKSGKKLILKEFPEYNRDKFNIEGYFSKQLQATGFIPLYLDGQNLMLFSEFFGEESLSKLKNKEELARHYDHAMDFMIELGKLAGKNHKIRLPYMEERKSSNLTLIHSNLYPEHVLIDSKGNSKIVDLEHICYGPAELALSKLLVNTFHDLGEEFIQERLGYYLSKNPGINKQEFYCNFEFYRQETIKTIKEKLNKLLMQKHSPFNEEKVGTALSQIGNRASCQIQHNLAFC